MFRRIASVPVQRMFFSAVPLASPARYVTEGKNPVQPGGKNPVQPTAGAGDDFDMSEDDMWFMDEMMDFGEGGTDNMDFVPPEEATILKSEKR